MSEKDNSAPLFSPFEIERQARIKRSLVIQSYVRGTMRAFAEWLRTFVLRSTQLTRGLARTLPTRHSTKRVYHAEDLRSGTNNPPLAGLLELNGMPLALNRAS